MKAVAQKKTNKTDQKVEQLDPEDDRLVMVMFPWKTWEMVMDMADSEGSDPSGIISRALNMYKEER